MTLGTMCLVSLNPETQTQVTITGAQDAGLVGALVQSGKYMEGDEKKGPGLPDFVFPGLLQAVKAVVESLK